MSLFSKKWKARKTRVIESRVEPWNAKLEEQKVQPLLEDNIATIKQLFADMDMVRYKTVQAEGKVARRYFLVFCDGLTDAEIINSNIVRPLMKQDDGGAGGMDRLLESIVEVGETQTTASFRYVVEGVTSGDTVLFAEGCDQAAILNTRKISLRPVEEPEGEKVLGGPQEGFAESLTRNLSQVIRRVHTSEFKAKMLTLGKRTKTPVCVCYLDSLADKNMLQDLLHRLNKIDIDGVLDSNYITELIRDQRYSLFRTIGYTERPDVIVAKLLEGRIAIFVEGSPMVLTIPCLFLENFQSSEDYYFSFYYTSVSRMMRISAFLLTLTIPGLYIASVAFHQEMLPLQLLIRVALERKSVPLPAAMEAVIMLLVFDMLRETGIRMPSNIGQALSIVGALVIGQAAVEASLVAAPMIIVVAATGITSLLVPKLNASIFLWRFFILLLASTFGFFGFTIAIAILTIHINNLTSFGVAQTSLLGSFRPQNTKDILVRRSWTKMIKRPSNLITDPVRQGGGNDNG